MRKLILLVGIPASGKTTLSKTLEEKGFARLCADDIRLELYGNEAEQGNPKDVFAIFFQRLETLLQADRDIVIDNTNVRIQHRRQILERAHKFQYSDIELWFLDTPLEVCLQRNKERLRQVDEQVLSNLFKEVNGPSYPRASEGRLVMIKPGEEYNKHLA